MSTLRKVQEQLTELILSPDVPAPSTGGEEIMAHAISTGARLNIYRHHYNVTLTDALSYTFSVTARLVGMGFFRYMMNAFIRAYPLKNAVVGEYGANLPAFIASFAPASSVPCLSDIAMMEWLLNEATQAVVYEGKMFWSRFPLASIWESNQPNFQGTDEIDLNAGGGWIVIKKGDKGVTWQWIEAPEDAFGT